MNVRQLGNSCERDLVPLSSSLRPEGVVFYAAPHFWNRLRWYKNMLLCTYCVTESQVTILVIFQKQTIPLFFSPEYIEHCCH